MEYDNTNTGAIFNSNSDQLILVGTGSLNDEGETKRIAMIKDVMPDGTTIRDIYVKVGRLWITTVIHQMLLHLLVLPRSLLEKRELPLG